MKRIITQIHRLYRKSGMRPPWQKEGFLKRDIFHPHDLDFFGIRVTNQRSFNLKLEQRVKTLRSKVLSKRYNNTQKVRIIMRELKRGCVKEEEAYMALPVVREWVSLVFGRRSVGEREEWLRKEIPIFLSEKEPSVAQRVFCFLLDSQIIPHDKFRFEPEMEILTGYYKRYQADPKNGLSEAEKGELAQVIEFLRFLQLVNGQILNTIREAVQVGIEIDSKNCKLSLTQKQKILMQNDDMRRRMLKVLRWTPTDDDATISLMKTLLGSPNWSDRMYAMGYLGKAAGRIFSSQPQQAQEIIKYILDRKDEVIREHPSFLVLEIVKVLLGDWDARQPFQRKWLSESGQSIAGLKSMAEDARIEPSIRRKAIHGLSLLAEVDPQSRARRAIRSLRKSESLISRQEAYFLADQKLLPVVKKAQIEIPIKEQIDEHVKAREQLLFYRGRLHPYTRLEDWEFVGLALGRGTSLFEIGIHDKKWLAIRKFAPVTPKIPRRGLIPAIERITSSLGWVLGMHSISKVQIVENEEARDSYFSYAIGQSSPIPPSLYDQIFRIKNAETELTLRGAGYRLEEVIWNLLLQMYEGNDMDSEEIERDPRFGKIVQENRGASTLTFLGQSEAEAEKWMDNAQRVFSNPEFLDQIKFFNWVVGNEDQYGYRNIMITGKQQEEGGQLFLIDLATCFGFLQKKDLDWRDHLRRFHSNMHMVVEAAPRVFIENIKPSIVNFLTLSEKAIDDILGEINMGELTREEKTALRLLILAEKEVLAKEFIKSKRFTIF